MSGTGRRRKPPVGEEGEPQGERSAFEPPAGQQWQTHTPEPEPRYDYDWREQAAPPAAPVPPAAAAPSPPAAEPWPPQYQQPYQEYQVPQPRWEQPGPAAPAAYADPEIPAAPPTSGAAGSAPASANAPAQPGSLFSRPKPRPEPAADPFSFEFDEDEAPAAPADDAARPAAGRPSDKDGYRPGDFAFVDEADNPEVKGWLEFSESRADARAERLRRLRTKIIAVVAVLVLAGAGYGAYSAFGGGTSTSAAAAATKSMLLFQLDDASGNSVGDALLVTERGGAQNGSDATGTGSVVVIPAKLRIQSDFGTQPFGGDMTGTPIEPPADDSEVAATLGVTPDGDLTMDETTFGIFVDELGGLIVTTNTAVPASAADPSGVKQGTSIVLTGAQAAAYATYQAAGESDSAQAVRFGQVVSALLEKMPTFGNAVTAQLNQLGLITKPSMPLSKLSPILAALAAQQSAGKITETVLPLSQDGTDTLNYAAAAPIVTKLLGGTMKAGASAGQAARVLVQDGTGLPSSKAQTLVADAEADLQNAGYTFNAGPTVAGQAKTVVEVASSSQQGLAQEVASALGLSGDTVKVVAGLSQVDDVTVVLGADWSAVANAS